MADNDFINNFVGALKERINENSPPYQCMNEIGCFIEPIAKAIAKVLNKHEQKKNKSSMEDLLRMLCKENYIETYETFSILHFAYGWRNVCSHDNESRYSFSKEEVDSNLLLVTKAFEKLDTALCDTDFRNFLREEQNTYPHYKYCTTLQNTIKLCGYPYDPGSGFREILINYAKNNGDIFSKLSIDRMKTESIFTKLLESLLNKDLNETANHFWELAKKLEPAFSSQDWKDHIKPWVIRNKSKDFIIDNNNINSIKTLHITLDYISGSNEWRITNFNIINPVDSEKEKSINSDIAEVRFDNEQLVNFLKNYPAKNKIETKEYILQIQVSEKYILKNYHQFKERMGLNLCHLYKCLTVQLLIENNNNINDNNYRWYGTLNKPLQKPSDNSNIFTITHSECSESESCTSIATSYHTKKFDCLLAVESAADTDAKRAGIVKSFEHYTIAIINPDPDISLATNINAIFQNNNTELHLPDFLERINQERIDEDNPKNFIILWNDNQYQPKKAEGIENNHANSI